MIFMPRFATSRALFYMLERFTCLRFLQQNLTLVGTPHVTTAD